MGDEADRFLSLATAAVKGAIRAGASHAEAFAGHARGIGVEVENSSVKSAESGHGESLSIRAFVDGAAGFMTVEGLEGTDATDLGKRCAETAAAATPDPHFVDLPHPDPAPEVDGLYDEAVERFDVGQAVQMAVAAIEEARAARADVVLQGDVGIDVTVGALANSNGIEMTRRGTSVQLGWFAIVRQGEEVGSYHDFDIGRNLADVEPVGLSKRVTDEAVRYLGARKVETGRRDIVLGPLAAYAFIQSLIGAANAEGVQRGRSFFVDRQGQRIGAPALTIIDDPLVPRGIRSGSHDGEGTRRRRLSIIDQGVLTTYLHNSYTAHKAGVASTGHASGGGGISATNVRVPPGARTAAEIIADTADGIYVNPGSIAPDTTTGDVSSPIDFGYRILNGAMAHPVVNCLVGGTIWELLERIDAISSDYREEPGTIMPTIRIRDCLVAGGG